MTTANEDEDHSHYRRLTRQRRERRGNKIADSLGIRWAEMGRRTEASWEKEPWRGRKTKQYYRSRLGIKKRLHKWMRRNQTRMIGKVREQSPVTIPRNSPTKEPRGSSRRHEGMKNRRRGSTSKDTQDGAGEEHQTAEKSYQDGQRGPGEESDLGRSIGNVRHMPLQGREYRSGN